MDAYDTSAEYLRNRVEQMAQEISQQAQARAAGSQAVQPYFISDIINGVENAVNGVVNATHDAVNAAVNATHSVVNAVANIGERAIHATEEAVNAVTAHTQQIVQVANLATDAIKVATFVTDFVGAASPTDTGVSAGKAGSQASVDELIQTRRTAILQQRTSITNDIASKRTELKSKIAAVSVQVSNTSSGSGPSN